MQALLVYMCFGNGLGFKYSNMQPGSSSWGRSSEHLWSPHILIYKVATNIILCQRNGAKGCKTTAIKCTLLFMVPNRAHGLNVSTKVKRALRSALHKLTELSQLTLQSPWIIKSKEIMRQESLILHTHDPLIDCNPNTVVF